MATKKTPAGNPETATNAPVLMTITPPKFKTLIVPIIGLSPLVVCKFSAKAREQMKANQSAGSQSKKGKTRVAKDFDAVYHDARHLSEEGWDGIHAGAFRNAMIDACRLVGFKMTMAKLGVFIEADGIDADEGVPLVRIIGEARKHEAIGRNATGVPDVRVRPMFWPWRMGLRVRFDEDMFSASDVTNLLARAGQQVGIGEGRPFSKNSAGMGWGTFKVG